jgi:tetraacyldisaccharide 4'-kinase
MTNVQQKKIINKIKPFNYQSVFFTKIDYAEEIINREKNIILNSLTSPFLLITGIANPDPLVSYLEEKKLRFNHLRFSNHHQFSSLEIKKIKEKNSNKIILTTEKDFGRLESYFKSDVLFYLPISMSFFDNKETKRFQNLLKATLAQD